MQEFRLLILEFCESRLIWKKKAPIRESRRLERGGEELPWML